MSNDQTLEYIRQDHTLGVLLRTELLKNPNVLFAAYKVPHPLKRSVHLRVKTTDDSDVQSAIDIANDNLLDTVDAFASAFKGL